MNRNDVDWVAAGKKAWKTRVRRAAGRKAALTRKINQSNKLNKDVKNLYSVDLNFKICVSAESEETAKKIAERVIAEDVEDFDSVIVKRILKSGEIPKNWIYAIPYDSGILKVSDYRSCMNRV